MTRENSLLTNSQEELLLQEYMTQGDEMKELGSHLDIEEPYSSFSNLELTRQNSFLHQGIIYEQDQEQTLLLDDKIALHQQIAIVEEQHQLLQQHQQLFQQQQHQQQQLTTPIQCKEEFAGDYNFEIIWNQQNSTKNWVYSKKLQKVFIDMEQVLPMQFTWTPPQDGLWVRATMVYKLDQHRSQPVVRCYNHSAPENNSNRNIDLRQVKHVIRSTHNTSIYEEAQNGHLSVLTPLGTPEAGVTSVPMDFVFYCKNSCTSGMNRRPTELILTLETEQNQILGRRKLEVRVCSCPRRDKEKEEKEIEKTDQAPVGPGKKRKIVQGSLPPGKKILSDPQPYNLNIKILGRENYNSVIKFAHDVMAGSACRTNNHELYKPYMDGVLQKYINQ